MLRSTGCPKLKLDGRVAALHLCTLPTWSLVTSSATPIQMRKVPFERLQKLEGEIGRIIGPVV
jgi:hypothetical protein